MSGAHGLREPVWSQVIKSYLVIRAHCSCTVTSARRRGKKGIWHKADDLSSEQSLPFTTSGGGSRASSMGFFPNRGPLLAIAHKHDLKKKKEKEKSWRVVYSERMDETSFFFIYPEPDMWLRSLGPRLMQDPVFCCFFSGKVKGGESLVKASHVLCHVTVNCSIQSFKKRQGVRGVVKSTQRSRFCG